MKRRKERREAFERSKALPWTNRLLFIKKYQGRGADF